MEKPKRPIEPNCADKKKYPTPLTNYLPNEDFIRDYRQYQKDVIQYEKDLELFEQTKLIKLIKNADIKLILRKYKIIKK